MKKKSASVHVHELFSLEGRVAVVTGGARNLGFDMAEALAEAGADVAITSRRIAGVRKSTRGIADRTGRRVLPLVCDVRSETSVKKMVKALFHPDAEPTLLAEAERRMQKTSPDAAYTMFLSLAAYNQAASARKLAVPLRAINGDLFPTNVDSVRKIKADFEAVVMKHMGHYPMLERPEEFNQLVADVARKLSRETKAP